MPWLRVKATQTALGGNSVTSVTIDRIAVVQAHITEAVTRTSASSTLSEQEQNKLLAQSCAEACDLLKDWLADAWWDRSRPSSDTPIKEVVPTQKELASFLGPMFKASLARARQGGVDVPDSLVDEAREKVAATARRFPRMGRQQLFRQAADRVRILQEEVCGLASQIGAATCLAAKGTQSPGQGERATPRGDLGDDECRSSCRSPEHRRMGSRGGPGGRGDHGPLHCGPRRAKPAGGTVVLRPANPLSPARPPGAKQRSWGTGTPIRLLPPPVFTGHAACTLGRQRRRGRLQVARRHTDRASSWIVPSLRSRFPPLLSAGPLPS